MFDESDVGERVAPSKGARVWIECRKCRATMFSTFDRCWSCGTPMTEKTSLTVRF